MKVVAIVQARMGSSRLPGKALADLGGVPVIQYVLERAERAETVDEVVLATTWLEEDDTLAGWARDNGWGIFRGHPTDVVHRLRVAAEWAEADVIVRLTGDCPMLEPGVIDRVVRALQGYDFASNVIRRTYPDGLDVEVFWMETLVKLDNLDGRTIREGPTTMLYERPDVFVGNSVESPTDHSDVRLTIDTQEDLDRLREMVAQSAS